MPNWFTRLFDPTATRRQMEEWGMFPLFLRLFDASPRFNDYSKEKEKILVALRNPALLKVISLQCDLFSLGKIKVFKGDDEIVDDPVLKVLNNPNKLQSRSQWLWDFMFWNMIGTAYLYVDSDIPGADNNLYFLDSSKIEWPATFEKDKDKLIFSKKGAKDITDITIKYRYSDGTVLPIPFSKIICITDLTNGVGNWFKSPSRIDALTKIIDNSEKALDAENINLFYSGKFMVAGQADPNDASKLPLGESEKESIEKKVASTKNITAVKSMIDIKRFVSDMSSLQLPESYLKSYYLIGSMYNIPRDVLEAYADKGSTFDNQEKATSKHISYCFQPKGDDLMEHLSRRWGYTDRRITIDWSYLPFMQVMELEQAKLEKLRIDSFCLLLDQGVSLDEVTTYLDLPFKTGEKNAKPTNVPTAGISGTR